MFAIHCSDENWYLIVFARPRGVMKLESYRRVKVNSHHKVYKISVYTVMIKYDNNLE